MSVEDNLRKKILKANGPQPDDGLNEFMDCFSIIN